VHLPTRQQTTLHPRGINQLRWRWSRGSTNPLYSPSDGRLLTDGKPYALYNIDIDDAYSNPEIRYTFPHVNETSNSLY